MIEFVIAFSALIGAVLLVCFLFDRICKHIDPDAGKDPHVWCHACQRYHNMAREILLYPTPKAHHLDWEYQHDCE
jgi:hypothetical protein